MLEDRVGHSQIRRRTEVLVEAQGLPGIRQVLELALFERFLDSLFGDTAERHTSFSPMSNTPVIHAHEHHAAGGDRVTGAAAVAGQLLAFRQHLGEAKR